MNRSLTHSAKIIGKAALPCLLGCIFWLLSVNMSAQTAGPVQPEKTSSNLMRERILLNVDRNICLAGEKIWFRADYLLNGKRPPAPLSKVVYIELFNETGEQILGEKYRMHLNMAKGSVKVPRGVETGNFILRAYTKYQRNFTSACFTHTPLVVINPNRPPENRGGWSKDPIHIVPEGGDWCTGIKSRLAILMPPQLLEKSKSLAVTDQDHNLICHPKTYPGGLASVELKPVDSIHYQLRLVTRDNDTIRRDFPEVKTHGLSTATKRGEDHYRYLIKRNTGKKMPRYGHYEFKVISDDQLTLYHQSLSLSDEAAEVKIPFEVLGRGIHYFILYNPRGEIEKINPVYAAGSLRRDIMVDPAGKSFAPREKIEAGLHLPDMGNDTISLSVAVVRKDLSIPGPEKLQCLFIRNPRLIPEHFDISAHELLEDQLDLSMILYRHLHMDHEFMKAFKSAQQTELNFIPETRGLSLTGTLASKEDQLPLAGRQVCMSVLTGNPQFGVYKTRKNGEFVFTLSQLKGTQEIYLYPVDRERINKDFEIRLRENFHPQPPSYIDSDMPVDSNQKDLLDEIYVNHQISQIDKGSRNTDKVGRESRNMDKDRAKPSIARYFGSRVHTILLDEYIDLENMEEVFMELVHEVQVHKEDDRYELRIFGDQTYYRILPGKPLVFLDNLPVFDPGKIMNLHPSEIEKIEVVNEMYVLGDDAFSGVVMITTHTGHFAGVQTPSASVFAEYQALSGADAFPEITYEAQDITSPRPDFRTVLYWNPDIEIKNGTGDFSFFSSDRQGEYEILVRGYHQGEYLYGKTCITIGDTR